MNIENFDDFIANKLNQLSPPVDNDWDAFEKKLESTNFDMSEMSDQQFDELIHHNINQLYPTYNATHWNKLKEQIKIVETRVRTIFISKSLEVLAMLLIVFTFVNLSSYLDGPKDEIPAHQLNYAISTQNSEQNAISTANVESKHVIEEKNIQNHKNPIAPIENMGKLSRILELVPHLPQPYSTQKLTSSQKIQCQIRKVDKDFASNQVQWDAENWDRGELANNDIVNDENDIKSIEIAAENHLTSVDILHPLPLNIENNLESEMAKSYPMKIVKGSSKSKKAISAYVSSDINLINTPFDKLYSLASYNKEALNNSYGVQFSATKNNVELESGLGYSQRVYQPASFYEAFANNGDYYFEANLNKIHFDIINVPLNIKYHFIKNTNWSSYVMVGAALNLIANAQYDISNVLRKGDPPAGRFLPEESRLGEKNFTPGLFHEGGNFKDDYFASVGFGFGIEKKILPNLSFYIQPSYQRHVLSNDIGVGPNKDKIHTSSLQFGVKTILN